MAAWYNDELLTARWGEGVSTRAIGVEMGVTKNAVIGRAHRIGLPPRPSPILPGVNRKSGPAPAQPRRAPRVKIQIPAPPPRPPQVVEVRTRGTCCFPSGNPGKADFRFCGEPAVLGKPYCVSCSARAYRPRERTAA